MRAGGAGGRGGICQPVNEITPNRETALPLKHSTIITGYSTMYGKVDHVVTLVIIGNYAQMSYSLLNLQSSHKCSLVPRLPNHFLCKVEMI